MIATQHDGLSAIVVLIALGLLALQIYLIYAIIATRQDVLGIRQDVLEIKRLLQAGLPSGSGSAPGAMPPIPGGAGSAAASRRVAVLLRAAGANPAAVESVLMNQAAHSKSGAKGALKNPGQRVLTTEDRQAAQELANALEAAGGSVEIVPL